MTTDNSISAVTTELASEIKKIRRELGGFDYATCEDRLAQLLVERSYGRVAQAAQEPVAAEYIEMAQARLRAAMIGDEPCKDCIDLAASYLTEATALLASPLPIQGQEP